MTTLIAAVGFFYFIQMGGGIESQGLSNPFETMAECRAAQQIAADGVRYGPEGAQYEADGLRQAVVSECFERPDGQEHSGPAWEAA